MTAKSVLTRTSGFIISSLLLLGVSIRAQDTGELSGSLQLNVGTGSNSPTDPAYVIASSPLGQEPTYTGAVLSVSANVITFAAQEDIEGNSNDPFVTGTLASGVVRAKAEVDVDDGPITAIIIVTAGSGFTAGNEPTVTIGDPESGTDGAEGTAVLSGDTIGSITFVGTAGNGYKSADPPSVTVDSGKHFIRITSGDNEGRSFLILSNTATTVEIDPTYLGSSNGTDETNAEDVFSANDTVEIVRASTLGDLFGATDADVSDNLTSGQRSSSADWVFLWDNAIGFYLSYYFTDGSGRGAAGWYRTNDRRGRRIKNDEVINPDESFIIACRNTAQAQPKFNGSVILQDPQLKLPAAGGHFLMTNPYGADVLLAELLPNDGIGTTANGDKFYPADNDEDGDAVYVLQSGGTWDKYHHKNSNVGITEVATCTAIRVTATAGGTVSSAYLAYPPDPSTLSTGHKCTIEDISNPTADSVTPANGYMDITTRVAHGLEPGDIVTITGAKGYKTQDGDPNTYIDANGDEVATTGEALQIDTSANGTWSVFDCPSDSRFRIAKSGNAKYIGDSAYWATGTRGAGYTANGTAKIYFVGPAASFDAFGRTSAFGTATVDGDGFVEAQTIDGVALTGGSAYGTDAPPQAVFSSGSWRESTDASTDVGNKKIEAGAGILISRHGSKGGKLTYLKSYSPVK